MESSYQSQEWKEEKNGKCGGRGARKDSKNLPIYICACLLFDHQRRVRSQSRTGLWQSCALPQPLSRHWWLRKWDWVNSSPRVVLEDSTRLHRPDSSSDVSSKVSSSPAAFTAPV